MDEERLKQAFKKIKKDISDLKDRQEKITNILNELQKRKEKQTNRLVYSSNRLEPISQTIENLKYDEFSKQKKNIIKMFLQYKEMALSYKDLSKLLNKSANTIKAQMREIMLKSDIFHKTIGEDNRSRFRLKQDLKIEKSID